jgi:hypothetical protein
MMPGMSPALDNGGRWHHFASEEEVKRAMGDKNAQIIEAPVIGCTFIVSRATCITLRTSAMGGDLFEIEGGWVYTNDIAQLLDRNELLIVAGVELSR